METFLFPSSSAFGQTEVLALVPRIEAVVIASTTAVPKANALVLLRVEEPHRSVFVTVSLVLAQETVVCTREVITHKHVCVCECL